MASWWPAPLLGMLNSCAAGVSVVNIDNGFVPATGCRHHRRAWRGVAE
jgi:NCAIR mutase (PurE)-related protein